MVLRVVAGLAGALIVGAVVMSALRTVVLPRGEPVRVTGLVFRSTRVVFDLGVKLLKTFEARDRLMAHYAPVSLLLLPLVWLSLAWFGFSLLFWAMDGDAFTDALRVSGSSLTTLGFERPDGLGATFLAFFEAALAMSVLALLLVTYLPSIYSAFSDREQLVNLFEVSAGTPPSAVEMMIRYSSIRGMAETQTVWLEWERWFSRVAESHTDLPALVFFRSPKPAQHWVTSAGAVLDAAAMMVAVIDLDEVELGDGGRRLEDGQPIRIPRAEICIRAGSLALRRIAGFFDLDRDGDPAPDDPISISRGQFDEALAELESAGVPLRADRDQAWKDWAGWRVNYDAALLALADLTVAPPAPWINLDHEPHPASANHQA